MKNTPNVNPFTALIHAFTRYHFTIFIVVIVSGLATAVLVLNAIIIQSSDTTNYTSSLDVTYFDQASIDRVKQLRSSSEAPSEFTFPPGRTSPFAE